MLQRSAIAGTPCRLWTKNRCQMFERWSLKELERWVESVIDFKKKTDNDILWNISIQTGFSKSSSLHMGKWPSSRTRNSSTSFEMLQMKFSTLWMDPHALVSSDLSDHLMLIVHLDHLAEIYHFATTFWRNSSYSDYSNDTHQECRCLVRGYHGRTESVLWG